MRQDANVVNRIKEVQSFPSLLKFLRDDLDWPITSNDVEDLTFDYSPDELGFDKKMAVQVRSIKQLRPLVKDQPWGIFYIDFEPKRLPVGALRRLLRSLVVKKRGGGDGSQATWNLDDLLFISFHGEESRRTVAFAHFHERDQKQPQLRTFYWDQGETEFASVLESLGKLNWPQYAGSAEMAHVWRQYWGAAFRVGHGEVIRDSKALSKKLAQVALKIRQHVFDLLDAEDADKGPLHRLFASFKKALLHDLDEQRFADVLAQTFTYGLLAAKAEIGTRTPLEPGHLAEQIPATNPLLRELFEEFQHLTGVGLDKLDEDLGDLGVDELVDLLNTVDVDEALKNFGRTTMSGQEDPVVHFYEEFLKDYDKEQKVERGVFYTPKPVVSFIVRSVHEILQKEFGLEDGLASTATWDDMVAKHEGLAKPEGIRGDEPFVQILDPAVGTGTFLEACIQLIYDTMAAKWSRAGKEVKAEWNSYVPERLLPRLHGFELMMAPYVVCHMKLGLRLKELGYDFQSGERLRVYLTNTLEPGRDNQTAFVGMVAAVAREAYAANTDKVQKRFTVILGNPPYSGLSSNMTGYAQELVERYKFINGQSINERKLWLQDDYVKFISQSQTFLESAGIGALGLVTNHGYLKNPTFRAMRWSLLETFRDIYCVDLHGNVNKKEVAPDGSEDKPVFDIRQGVAVFLGITGLATPRQFSVTDIFGSRLAKYDWLTKNDVRTLTTSNVLPYPPFFLFSSKEAGGSEYEGWLKLTEVFNLFGVGAVMARDSLTVAFQDSEIWSTILRFVSLTPEAARLEFGLGKDARDWKVSTAMADVRQTGPSQDCISKLMYRPFDYRSTYYTGKSRGFYASPCHKVMKHLVGRRNVCLLASRNAEIDRFEHVFCTSAPVGHHSLSLKEVTYAFPLWIYDDAESLLDPDQRHSNLADCFTHRLATLGLADVSPEDALGYVYAVLHSPEYRERYLQQLKLDYPRVPVPVEATLFRDMSQLGSLLIAAHQLQIAESPDKFVFSGRSGVRLASKPDYGNGTLWVDDSRSCGFLAVPEEVWLFSVGGYQPAERWLRDRRGRLLTDGDILHCRKMLCAIEETIRIMAEIDEVIEAHGGWPGAFQGGVDG